jgi:hypothetical protein
MNFQAIFLDASPKNPATNSSKSSAGDFLVRNVKEFRQADSILVTHRSSNQLKQIGVGAELKSVNPPGLTRGALATALLTVDFMTEDHPIVLLPTNSHLESEVFYSFVSQMIQSNNSAGTVCVRSNNPIFSYVRVFEGKVIEVVEKRVVGDLATTGIFFFKSKDILVESANWSFVNNQSTDRDFYIAPCLNYVLSKGLSIGYHVAESKEYIHAG